VFLLCLGVDAAEVQMVPNYCEQVVHAHEISQLTTAAGNFDMRWWTGHAGGL
jgi:hypothetical protein